MVMVVGIEMVLVLVCGGGDVVVKVVVVGPVIEMVLVCGGGVVVKVVVVGVVMVV